MKKLGLLVIALFCSSIVFCMNGNTAQAQEEFEKDTIPAGVYIEGMSLEGLTEEEALNQVQQYVEDVLSTEIVLSFDEEHEVTITAGDLGVYWSNTTVLNGLASLGKSGNIVKRYKELINLEKNKMELTIDLGFNSSQAGNVLEEQCVPFDVEKQEPYLVRKNNEFSIVKGVDGISVDVSANLRRMKEYFVSGWERTDTEFELSTKIVPPVWEDDCLSQVTDVLGTYTTSFHSSGEERSGNVRNAANRINGQTVYPGEEFSTLTLMLPFTVANGYALADSYAGGRVVESVGGGVCQVSSTLYNAVLFAELEVTCRKNHAMIVSYVPLSADATVSSSSNIDFTWVNNTDYPVYVECYTTDKKRVVVNIYGHDTGNANRTISFESEVISETPGTGERIYTDSKKPIGSITISSAHTGYEAQRWKIVSIDGVETERYVVSTSKYKATPRTATVGTSTNDPELRAILDAAIATGSIDQVREVANNIRNGVYVTTAMREAAAQAAAQAVTTPATMTEETDGSTEP